MGTMGFGIPAAIGAQIAYPDKTVIDVDGDGSIRMNLGDLETITNYGLPVKVLLLNNSGDGMVKQWQKLYYGGRLSASDKTLHTKDFIMSAKSDGFQFAERLSEQSKVEETIERFINFEKAAFLEVFKFSGCNAVTNGAMHFGMRAFAPWGIVHGDWESSHN